MKRYTLSLLLVPLFVLSACRSEPPADVTALYDRYGEAITDEGAVPVQAVVAERAQYVGRPVKVEGIVAEVCQVKGCWLTLRTGDGDHIRIVMPRKEDGSDYVFTVPKDLSGRRVIVAGTLTEETLSEDEHQHLAEDAGEAVRAGTAPPGPELQVTARGVLVQKV